MSVKILVADDHPIVCEGIRNEVQAAGMEFLGAISSRDKIVDSVNAFQPDVLITEVRLAGQDALKSLESLGGEGHACKVVVFSANSNPTNIARASALGCHEFILKTSACVVLMTAVTNAAAGVATPPNSLLKTIKSRMQTPASAASPGPLTSRETQVLRHVAMGLSNREIGKSLSISIETVKEHVQNTLRKLDVNDRTQAAVWAIRNEMI